MRRAVVIVEVNSVRTGLVAGTYRLPETVGGVQVDCAVTHGYTTNGIENVWSLLKRSIIGSYHQLSAKHLDAYLDEMEWRFNNRDNPYLFEDTMRAIVESENLEYKELTA